MFQMSPDYQPSYGKLPSYSTQHLSPIPQMYAKHYRNHNEENKVKERYNEEKSFLDGFDNNNSSYLNQNKSFARNLRGRLFNNQDPKIERAREERVKSYKEEILRQMEADRIRKEKQKKLQEEQQLKRQKKFYENVKIEAQKKKPTEKEGNAYFLMRTNYKKMKEENQEKQKPNLQNEQQESKVNLKKQFNSGQIVKNYYKKSRKEDWERDDREKSYEEERIGKILLFQENMMKKLQFMKTQIRNTSSYLQIDKEVDRIRFKLKSNPSVVESIEKKEAKVEESDFYSLPKRKVVKPPHSRYQFRLNDLKQKSVEKEGEKYKYKENPQELI